jgi:hypothetical protein
MYAAGSYPQSASPRSSRGVLIMQRPVLMASSIWGAAFSISSDRLKRFGAYTTCRQRRSLPEHFVLVILCWDCRLWRSYSTGRRKEQQAYGITGFEAYKTGM